MATNKGLPRARNLLASCCRLFEQTMSMTMQERMDNASRCCRPWKPGPRRRLEPPTTRSCCWRGGREEPSWPSQTCRASRPDRLARETVARIVGGAFDDLLSWHPLVRGLLVCFIVHEHAAEGVGLQTHLAVGFE